MTNTSNHCSIELPASLAETLAEVTQVLVSAQVPYIMIGATARDLVMHSVHGLAIQRATRDQDYGIQLSSWDRYQDIKNLLIARNFRQGRQQHRLHSPQGIPIDLLPFGGLESKGTMLAWPPDFKIIMNTLGFIEAQQDALTLKVIKPIEFELSVVSIRGLLILKLISWSERAPEQREKDALDIAYLLKNYHKIKEVENALYEEAFELQEETDHDLTLAGAMLLGQRLSEIASTETMQALELLLASDDNQRSREQLVYDMSPGNTEHWVQQNRALLKQMLAGMQI